ncbi:MAG: GMC oxidoreductase [Burkholderiaceae bacterium]
MSTRRSFIDLLGRFGIGGAVAPIAACGSLRQTEWPAAQEHFDLVVIGSGFGGTLTALTVAYQMDSRLAGRASAAPLRILMLERGTWWTTPTETIQDKQVKTRDFLVAKGQPTQEWSSLADYRGMVDLLRRCRYSAERPQGLYDFMPIGKRGVFNLQNDGVSVLRASGVGGGSLIYSKILIRPPESVYDDPRWPGAWRGASGNAMRNRYYRRALQAVTRGVETLMPGKANEDTGLTGPSNIVTRAPGWTPAVRFVPRFDSDRKLLQIAPKDARRIQDTEGELIDRARVFQTAVAALKPALYGTVDLGINDMEFDANAKAPNAKPMGKNVCERHGRCNVGCLPGAGQTLNKQIQRAIYGKLATGGLDAGAPGSGSCVMTHVALQLRALAQVDHVSELAEGGYRVHYVQRPIEDPAAAPRATVVSASRVVFAAGSLGTAELLLRSRQRSVESKGASGLHALSDTLGHAFSGNGDHIAFLPETKERVNLTYGPVTTSFAWFAPNAPQAQGFHNLEDQGVPRSMGPLTGYGVEVMNRLAHDEGLDRWIEALGNSIKAASEIFSSRPTRTYAPRGAADLSADRPEAEDELSARMMCVVVQGRDAADGRFRLEDDRLRVSRPEGQRFVDDPIYRTMEATLDKLAQQLRPEGSNARFIAPLSDGSLPGVRPVVLTSHPLGGCPMGDSAASGVVDETGRVFRRGAAVRAVYPGLYVADGSMVPTSLGVNPALTISAIALRVADQVLADWDDIAARGPRAATPLQCV